MIFFENLTRRLKYFSPSIYRLLTPFIKVFRNHTNGIKAKKRAKLSIFSFEELAQPIGYSSKYPNDNDLHLYGIGDCLSKYFEIDNSSVEHGFVVGSFVSAVFSEVKYETIFTFSDYRKDIIHSAIGKRKVICVGPYIHYAKSLLNGAAFDTLKEDLGRILLVFPVHTLIGTHSAYDKEEFIKIIRRKSSEFDTVLVCGYWADILKGNMSSYIEAGFKVVTAGYNMDPYFLSRLKTILELSDTVLTNSFGTHVGYSMYLKKFTILIEQDVKHTLLDKNSKEFSQRTSNNWASYYSQIREISNVFQDSISLTENTIPQKALISRLFGFENVKNTY